MTFAVVSSMAASHATPSLNALHSALANGGGGAAAAAFAFAALTGNENLLTTTSTALSSSASSSRSHIDDKLLALRGGARQHPVAPKGKDKGKPVVTVTTTEPSKRFHVTPQGKSVILMAVGMACHYLGYSLARSITVTLFTSSTTGYAHSPGAFPLAMAFVSPLSLLMLMGYSSTLEAYGPRGALVRSTLFCAVVLLVASGCIQAFAGNPSLLLFGYPIMKYVTGPLFVFRESYVQLLTSQYWSFFASILTPDQSAKWFGPITGLTSIASAVSGLGLAGLTRRIGLSGALACTSLSLIASLSLTERAYGIADENGFAPIKQLQRERSKMMSSSSSKDANGKKGKSKKGRQPIEPSSSQVHCNDGSMFVRAKALFVRVPILGALFWEILASQGLATLLNVCFVTSLGKSIPNDADRAGWVGNFYALINIVSMVLQFGVLPALMRVLEPRDLWRAIPIASLAFTLFQAIRSEPSLRVVSGSLLVMKVLEYSARKMLDEMVYVPLDFESRFLGKEIIGVFGYRLGKSLMSLSLSALTSAFGSFELYQLSVLSAIAAGTWVRTAWKLSSHVPTRTRARAGYYDAVSSAAQHHPSGKDGKKKSKVESKISETRSSRK